MKNARRPKAQDLNSNFGEAAKNKSKSNSKLHIYNFLILVRTTTKPKRKTKSSLRREKNLHTPRQMSVRKAEEPTLVPEKILVIFKKDLILVEMTITFTREEAVLQKMIIDTGISIIVEFHQEGMEVATKILMLAMKVTDQNLETSQKRREEGPTMRDMGHLQEAVAVE